MSLFKYLNFFLFQKQLMYTECNFIITFGLFTYRKIKTKFMIIPVITKSMILLFRSIICSLEYYILNTSSFYSIIQSFFLGSLIGYYHGFRLLGRGYKTYLQLNNYVFRLGYSHNIYFILPLQYKGFIKEKLKNFWLIKGVNLTRLSNIISKIRNFRIPNTYRYKGIYKMNDNYKLKLTKKGNAL